MKIVMKLCPNMKEINEVKPLLEETKENGIKVFTSGRMESLVRKQYGLLPGKDFDERVKFLDDLEKKGEHFFSIYAPNARFILVRDEVEK